MLVVNSTLPVLHGVSVRMTCNWLGLQISKSDDKHVNANGKIFDFGSEKVKTCGNKKMLVEEISSFLLHCLFCSFIFSSL